MCSVGIVIYGLLAVKLNGGRAVTGVLRGFDPFMNLVIDESIEETKTGEKHSIGMVVNCYGSSQCLVTITPRKCQQFFSLDGWGSSRFE